ncbi:MAG: hypothetical protein M3Q51_03740 [Pseudomonadota bacterium]|nr:hypothetical protein [Pseudomonadota bacterium]
MPWLFLLVALAAFAVAFNTSSVAVVVICLLVALGAVIMWVMGLLASRVGSRSRDESLMLNPDELRRMREQVEARRVAGQASEPPGS